jgi:hypothetical protein
MTIGRCSGVMFLVLVVCWGCSRPRLGEPRMKTYPVKGAVTVDGEPAALVEIECTPESGSGLQRPVVSVTDREGKFSIGTYESGDGLPEGNYVLTFKWVELGIGTKDKLRGAYADPKKSEHTFTVAEGQVTDLGIIDLSSRGPDKK